MAITIRYDADTRDAERNVRRLNSEVGQTTTMARRGQRALAAYFSVRTARRFVQALATASDTVTNIANQLQSAGLGANQVAVSLRAVADLSQQTRSSLEATGGLYARILRSTRDLGLSQREALRITQAFQESLALSGASTQEAAAASLQFGQALASGRLAGDELRSILENNSFFAQALARDLGVGVGALREMGAAGELTSETLARVALNIAPEINRQFEQLAPTFGQLATLIQNEVVVALSDVGDSLISATDDARGLATAIGEGLGTGIRGAATGIRVYVQVLRGYFSLIITAAQTFWNSFVSLGESAFLSAQNFAGSFASGLITNLNQVISFLTSQVNTLISLLNRTSSRLSAISGISIGEVSEIATPSFGAESQADLQNVLARNNARQAELAAGRTQGFRELAETWNIGVDRIVAAANATPSSRFAATGEVSDVARDTQGNASSGVSREVSEEVDRAASVFSNTLQTTFIQGIESGDFSGLRQALLGRLVDTFSGEGAFGRGLDALFDTLASTISNLFSSLTGGGGGGGIASFFSGLLGFATGGVVPGPVGAPQLALVHGGERISTPEQQRMGSREPQSVNLNLTFQTTGDVTEATQRAIRASATQINQSVESFLLERGVIT